MGTVQFSSTFMCFKNTAKRGDETRPEENYSGLFICSSNRSLGVSDLTASTGF